MRLHASADVWVYWESDRLRDVSHVRDLSMAGLFIETRRSRSKGDSVHIDFLVGEGQIRLEGIVVRYQPGGFGLKFQSADKEDIPQLRNLINRMQSASLSAPVGFRLFDFFS
jgi:PilZ domain